MMLEPKTIGEQIECLARLTGAPESFTDQVQQLFTRKGITLDSDASPYVKALEEAFQREESIRYNSLRFRRDLAQVQQGFEKVGQSYVKQVEQLRKIRRSLQERANRLRGKLRGNAQGTVEIQGNHRNLITKRQYDQLPMVPGPEEPQ